MNRQELNSATRFACRTALEAGAILKNGFLKPRPVTMKGRIDPVTEYDLKAERLIVRRIARQYPDHEILTEEGSAVGSKSDYCWVIDPLDGTVNFAHGFPVYCVSIALQYRGVTITGAVYDPSGKSCFGVPRTHSYLNRRIISVSRERRLERALLATGFAYDIGTARRNNLDCLRAWPEKLRVFAVPAPRARSLLAGLWANRRLLGTQVTPWDTAAATLAVTTPAVKSPESTAARIRF